MARAKLQAHKSTGSKPTAGGAKAGPRRKLAPAGGMRRDKDKGKTKTKRKGQLEGRELQKRVINNFIRQVRDLQKREDKCMIPKVRFVRLVRELAQDAIRIVDDKDAREKATENHFSGGVRFQKTAMDLLQIAAEDMLVDTFQGGVKLMELCDRQTLKPRHYLPACHQVLPWIYKDPLDTFTTSYSNAIRAKIRAEHYGAAREMQVQRLEDIYRLYGVDKYIKLKKAYRLPGMLQDKPDLNDVDVWKREPLLDRQMT